MWNAAEKAVQQSVKRGAKVQVQPDGNLHVEIDGRVVDVLPKEIDVL